MKLDVAAYETALVEARLRLGVVFDESKHPRVHGKFAKKAKKDLRPPWERWERTPALPSSDAHGLTGEAASIRTDIRRVRAEMGDLRVAAARHNMSVPEYDAAVREHARKELQRGKVMTRTTMKALAAILSEGQVKTSFAGAATRGKARTGGEAKQMDQRTAIESIFFHDHPIYGFVGHDGSLADSGLKQFGNVNIVFKDGIKGRTTFLRGDSLTAMEQAHRATRKRVRDITIYGRRGAVPDPYDAPTLTAFQGLDPEHDPLRFTLEKPGNRAGWAETQIHGPVTLSDIERIDLAAKPSAKLEAALKASGIPYKVHAK